MGKHGRDCDAGSLRSELMDSVNNMKLPSKNTKLRGVALMIVLISLALMTALISELSTRELVYYKLAINERDALKAEALAESGIRLAQLILLVQEPLQTYLVNLAKMGIPLPILCYLGVITDWELLIRLSNQRRCARCLKQRR